MGRKELIQEVITDKIIRNNINKDIEDVDEYMQLKQIKTIADNESLTNLLDEETDTSNLKKTEDIEGEEEQENGRTIVAIRNSTEVNVQKTTIQTDKNLTGILLTNAPSPPQTQAEQNKFYRLIDRIEQNIENIRRKKNEMTIFMRKDSKIINLQSPVNIINDKLSSKAESIISDYDNKLLRYFKLRLSLKLNQLKKFFEDFNNLYKSQEENIILTDTYFSQFLVTNINKKLEAYNAGSSTIIKDISGNNPSKVQNVDTKYKTVLINKIEAEIMKIKKQHYKSKENEKSLKQMLVVTSKFYKFCEIKVEYLKFKKNEAIVLLDIHSKISEIRKIIIKIKNRELITKFNEFISTEINYNDEKSISEFQNKLDDILDIMIKSKSEPPTGGGLSGIDEAKLEQYEKRFKNYEDIETSSDVSSLSGEEDNDEPLYTKVYKQYTDAQKKVKNYETKFEIPAALFLELLDRAGYDEQSKKIALLKLIKKKIRTLMVKMNIDIPDDAGNISGDDEDYRNTDSTITQPPSKDPKLLIKSALKALSLSSMPVFNLKKIYEKLKELDGETTFIGGLRSILEVIGGRMHASIMISSLYEDVMKTIKDNIDHAELNKLENNQKKLKTTMDSLAKVISTSPHIVSELLKAVDKNNVIGSLQQYAHEFTDQMGKSDKQVKTTLSIIGKIGSIANVFDKTIQMIKDQEKRLEIEEMYKESLNRSLYNSILHAVQKTGLIATSLHRHVSHIQKQNIDMHETIDAQIKAIGKNSEQVKNTMKHLMKFSLSSIMNVYDKTFTNVRDQLSGNDKALKELEKIDQENRVKYNKILAEIAKDITATPQMFAHMLDKIRSNNQSNIIGSLEEYGKTLSKTNEETKNVLKVIDKIGQIPNILHKVVNKIEDDDARQSIENVTFANLDKNLMKLLTTVGSAATSMGGIALQSHKSIQKAKNQVQEIMDDLKKNSELTNEAIKAMTKINLIGQNGIIIDIQNIYNQLISNMTNMTDKLENRYTLQFQTNLKQLLSALPSVMSTADIIKPIYEKSRGNYDNLQKELKQKIDEIKESNNTVKTTLKNALSGINAVNEINQLVEKVSQQIEEHDISEIEMLPEALAKNIDLLLSTALTASTMTGPASKSSAQSNGGSWIPSILMNMNPSNSSDTEKNLKKKQDKKSKLIPYTMLGGAASDDKNKKSTDVKKLDDKDKKPVKTLANTEKVNYSKILTDIENWIDILETGDSALNTLNNMIDDYKKIFLPDDSKQIQDFFKPLDDYSKVTKINKSTAPGINDTSADESNKIKNSVNNLHLGDYKNRLEEFIKDYKSKYEKYKKELNDISETLNGIEKNLTSYFSQDLSETKFDDFKEKVRLAKKDTSKQLTLLEETYKKLQIKDLEDIYKDKLLEPSLSIDDEKTINNDKKKLSSLRQKVKNITDKLSSLNSLDKPKDGSSITSVKDTLLELKGKTKIKSKSPIAKVAGVIEYQDETGNRVIADKTSPYVMLWNKYINDIKDGTKINEEIEDSMHTTYKANKLDPEVALEVTRDDKIIFVVIIFIIRQISLGLTEMLIDYNRITTLYNCLIVYAIFYILIIGIIILVVNLDDYKMRIVFNYFNMHINPSGISLHLFLVIGLMIMMYILMYNIYKDFEYKTNTITEIEKMRLVYKLELMTIFIYVMTAAITLLS
jgi:hypothetical protein